MQDAQVRSEQMRCVTLDDGAVIVAKRRVPNPKSGDLLIKVSFAGMNGADVLQQRGRYPPPPGYPSDRPGLEFAGTVAKSTVNRIEVGQRVMGLIPAAAQSEYVLADHRQVLPVPAQLPDREAGGFCEIFMTAYQALFDQAGLSIGDRVLINGAAGGVGTAAVQLAASAGATVVASSRNANAQPLLRSFGATAVTPGEVAGDFDIILELVGAPNLKHDLASLRRGGRIVIIGVGAGAKTEINLLGIMSSAAQISGTTIRAMPDEERLSLTGRVARHVLPLIEAGTIRVPVEQTFALDEAAAAYEFFTRPGKLGKVILQMAASDGTARVEGIDQ